MDVQSNTIEPIEINGIEYKIIKKLEKEYNQIKNKLLLEIWTKIPPWERTLPQNQYKPIHQDKEEEYLEKFLIPLIGKRFGIFLMI